MTEQHSSGSNPPAAGREDTTSALFAQLILQQSNMALMLLGKVAHPESGQTYKDVEAARLFIDQLEMLETKTKGNLNREESALLKQTLMSLHLAFVEAVEAPPEANKSPAAAPHSDPTPAQPANSATGAAGESSAATEDEHRKKFTKKY